METRFQLRVVLGAAILFVGVFSFISTARADKAGNAAKAAEAAVAKAEALAKRCQELKAVASQANFELDVATQRAKDAAGTSEEGAREKERQKALKNQHETASAANEKCGDARKAVEDADALIKAAEKALKEKTDRGAKDDDDVGGALDKLKKRSDDLKPKKQESIALPGAGQTTESKTANGLRTVTFDTPPGRVTVNLPDDMMAGDTISGTVIEEPKGANKAEKEKNQKVLEGMVVDLEGTKVKVGQPRFTWVPPIPQSSPPRYQIRIIEVMQTGAPTNSPNGYFSCFIPAYEAPKLSAAATDTIVERTDIKIPSLGQTGRPIEIIGPFDGNSDNTTVHVGDQTMVPLAESPRKLTVPSPPNVVGPTQITVKEGNTETKGEFRNLKVDLTAPKTTLLRGEKTELHVEVQGLQGITQPVPLHLNKIGVVTMQGGDTQTMSIKPSDVQSNGTFNTTRTITGEQTGGFSVTATVVVFNVCLQDDNNGSFLMFDSQTGDYAFCNAPRAGAGANPISLSTVDVERSGILPQGNYVYDVQRSGMLQQGDWHSPMVLIHVEMNRGTHTGNATVQTANPKQTFTITDRDTRNNTCACK
jgi:hypothetical protein